MEINRTDKFTGTREHVSHMLGYAKIQRKSQTFRKKDTREAMMMMMMMDTYLTANIQRASLHKAAVLTRRGSTPTAAS